MPKAIVYVNVPLYADEHKAIADLAKREGRAKGQQLRILAVQSLSEINGVVLVKKSAPQTQE